MCFVELNKLSKGIVSCAIAVSKGMVLFTDTPLLKKDRESMLEFLLVNHPLDCPICDQGGECDLQDITFFSGSDRGRYFFFKRGVEDQESGPIISMIMTRCIHCTRCLRFSSQILGKDFLGSSSRGEKTEISQYKANFIRNELSGNLVPLCPVGNVKG
jgi:NADH dehydrogenase/NADH:ubiquinone oxidoreductase subunit G